MKIAVLRKGRASWALMWAAAHFHVGAIPYEKITCRKKMISWHELQSEMSRDLNQLCLESGVRMERVMFMPLYVISQEISR